MTRLLRSLSKRLFIVAVLGGLTFGAVSVAQGLPAEPCGEDPGELGECPPFNDQTCFGACYLWNGNGGVCMLHSAGPDCCTCMI